MSVNTLATYGPLATCRIAWRAVRLAAPRLRDVLRPELPSGTSDDDARVARARSHMLRGAVTPVLATASPAVLDGVLVGLGSFFVFLELLYHVVPRDVEQALRLLGIAPHAPEQAGA